MSVWNAVNTFNSVVGVSPIASEMASQARCQLPFTQLWGKWAVAELSAAPLHAEGLGRWDLSAGLPSPYQKRWWKRLLESLQEDWLCLLCSSWFKILRCSSDTWLRQQKCAGEKLCCFQVPAKIQASSDWLSLVLDCQWLVQNVLTLLSPAMDKFIQSESCWSLIWAELPGTEPVLSGNCCIFRNGV